MRRHVRARFEIEPQRPGRFEPVQIEHFGFVQHREIAGLAEIGHQIRQDGMPQPACA
jgi:hypothetical protein